MQELNQALIKVARMYGRGVKFVYAKNNGAILETRKLFPEAILRIKGNLVVTGQDPDREDVRTYRIDRIKGMVSVF